MNSSSPLTRTQVRTLNENWTRVTGSKVCFNWTKEGNQPQEWGASPFGNQSEETKSARQNYNFGEMIGKIKTLQSEGKTICLFVGRTPLEKLPSDQGEAKENEVWVSADISLKPYCSWNNPCIESTDLTQRLYLWLDLNERRLFVSIKGLFDKIVFDQSTSKFLGKNFYQHFSILLHSDESEMLFKDPSTYQERPDKIHPQDISSWQCAAIKEHLETIFHTVEHHEGTDYPYKGNYSGIDKSHFIVRHPKT